MRTYITIVLLFLALSNTKCKKEENNYAQNIQGTWVRAYSSYTSVGLAYPTAGTIYKVNFNRTTATLYINDTLFQREHFTITKYQDPYYKKEMPRLNSKYIFGGPFYITEDTLCIYHPDLYDAPNDYYIRYK